MRTNSYVEYHEARFEYRRIDSIFHRRYLQFKYFTHVAFAHNLHLEENSNLIISRPPRPHQHEVFSGTTIIKIDYTEMNETGY